MSHETLLFPCGVEGLALLAAAFAELACGLVSLLVSVFQGNSRSGSPADSCVYVNMRKISMCVCTAETYTCNLCDSSVKI